MGEVVTMDINKMISRYDESVNERFLALIPACEGDVLYVIGLREEIDKHLSKLDKKYVDLLGNIDKRLIDIARKTRTPGFILSDNMRDDKWWNNLDKI